MSFNASSYFAGVATVVVATAVGFSGGFMITKDTSKTPPATRVERVASTTPIPGPSTVEPNATSTDGGGSNIKTIEITRAAAAPAPIPESPQSLKQTSEAVKVMASDSNESVPDERIPDATRQAAPIANNVGVNQDSKIQEQTAKAKRAAAKRQMERTAARKQRDLDMVVESVKRLPRDDEPRAVAQGTAQSVSFGGSLFGPFGND